MRAVGKTVLIDRLAEVLEYPKISAGASIREMAKSLDMTQPQFEAYAKQNIQIHRDLDRSMHARVLAVPACLADWRMGFMYVDIPDVIKIKLCADKKVRAERTMNRPNAPTSLDEARLIMEQEENPFLAAMLELYHGYADMKDKHFDTVIDTTSMTEDQVFYEVVYYLILEQGFSQDLGHA